MARPILVRDEIPEATTFSRSFQMAAAVTDETGKPSLPALAEWVVKTFRASFHGWPGGVHYIEPDHEERLDAIRSLLPARLAETSTSHLWGHLTMAVNHARARERKAYLKQVAVGGDVKGEL